MNLSFQIFSKKRTGSRSLTRFHLMHPERDWLVGLGLSGFVFCVGASIAGWLFLSGMQLLDQNQQELTTPRASYKHAKVTEVLKEYRTRDATFKELNAKTKMPVVTSEGGNEKSATSSATRSASTTPAEAPVAEEGDVQVE